MLAALREISEAIGVGGMVGGQYVDVAGAASSTPTALRHMHELKTGRLIAASVAVAPLLLGAPEDAQLALGRFAGELGVLFQIVDDILDVTGSEEADGQDERLGRAARQAHLRERLRVGARRGSSPASPTRRRAAALDRRERCSPATPRDLERITDFMYRREA